MSILSALGFQPPPRQAPPHLQGTPGAQQWQQWREMEFHLRRFDQAIQDSTGLFRRELSAANLGFSIARLGGASMAGAGLYGGAAFAASAGMHAIQSLRDTAEATVPKAFPGLAIQREYAERDRAAAIGQGFAGAYEARTARERAGADFWMSTPGQALTAAGGAIAGLPDRLATAMFRIFTPDGTRGRSAGLAPDPRAGRFMSADELYRGVVSAGIQQSSVQVEQRDLLRQLLVSTAGAGGAFIGDPGTSTRNFAARAMVEFWGALNGWP